MAFGVWSFGGTQVRRAALVRVWQAASRPSALDALPEGPRDVGRRYFQLTVASQVDAEAKEPQR